MNVSFSQRLNASVKRNGSRWPRLSRCCTLSLIGSSPQARAQASADYVADSCPKVRRKVVDGLQEMSYGELEPWHDYIQHVRAVSTSNRFILALLRLIS